jgi:hypothetical protein
MQKKPSTKFKMIKALKKLGMEGIYLNSKGYIHSCPKWRKTETVSSKVKNKTRVSILPTLTQYRARILSQSNKARERNKRNTSRKGRSQIIPSGRWYDPILKDHRDSAKKTLRSDKYSKVTICKINIKKQIAFLYTSNEQAEKSEKNPINNSLKELNT